MPSWMSPIIPKLSRSQIRKMKKNMKKVPIIKDKSENYHKNDEKTADKLLEQELNNI